MKRFAFLLAVLISAVMDIETAEAQHTVTGDRRQVVITNPDGERVVDIRQPDDGRIVVRVASVEIVMDDNGRERTAAAPVPPKRRAAAFGDSDFQSFFELGINTLPRPDYALYGTLPDGLYDFMDLNNAKSLQFAFSLSDVTLYLNASRNLSLTAALQLVFNEYVFSQNVKLTKQNGMLVPEAIAPGYKKSKLSTSSLQVPVVFTIGRSDMFHLSLGVYGGVCIGSHTKIKFPKEKAYGMYMNPFYAGITARAGFHGFYIYCNYGLTDLFKYGKGPAVSPMTIGLGFGF